ncbi:MAG: glycosyltransferase [Rubripirellula sp.]
MRIGFISSNNGWGGGEKLLSHLIKEIRDQSHSIALVARKESPIAAWACENQIQDIFYQRGYGRHPAYLMKLRNWVGHNELDIIVLNDPHAITSGGIATWGLPTTRIGMRHTIFPIRSAWKHRYLVDHVACVSSAAQRECIAAGLSPEETSVIHGGIPFPKVMASDSMDARQNFQNESNQQSEQHILAVGSLLPVKGFDAIIRSIAAGIQSGHRWRLWLAGDGPELGQLATIAREEGIENRVEFLGQRDDVATLLTAADLFISASHSEGLSLVLIEAMMAECPIIATPVGGAREVLRIQENGESPYAEIFQPCDTSGLTNAIINTLRNSEERTSKARQAKQWAEQQFSAQRMADEHLALYKKLSGSKS